jgi:hypothetical protein
MTIEIGTAMETETAEIATIAEAATLGSTQLFVTVTDAGIETIATVVETETETEIEIETETEIAANPKSLN